MESRSAHVKSKLAAFHPEIGAGGFTRLDGTVEFYARVNALVRPDMTVLDYGAGRGVQLYDEQSPFRASLGQLKGKVAKLVGVDVDKAVLENPFVDEAHVIRPNERLPFGDESFDLIYSDWVIEHVDDPQAFASEAYRVLRPGGWFCARTPNRWGMTGIFTNLIPNTLHSKLLKSLQPDREVRDVFPTRYRMNTKGRIKRLFPAQQWDNFTYQHNAEPPYIQRSRLLLGFGGLYLRLTPQALATNLLIFLRKR